MGNLLFHLADATMPKEEFNLQKEDLELLLGEICINRIAGIAYRNLMNDPKINISNEVLKILKIVYENNLKRNKNVRPLMSPSASTAARSDAKVSAFRR